MSGPDFLQQELQDMPLSSDVSGSELPPEVLRASRVILLATNISGYQLYNLTNILLGTTNNLQHNLRLLARLVRAKVCNSREVIAKPVTAEELELATKLAFFFSMNVTRQALEKGQLDTLRIFEDHGILYTQGRAPPSVLETLLGTDKLPVVMPSTTLAWLIMVASHEEDHRRSSADTLARS